MVLDRNLKASLDSVHEQFSIFDKTFMMIKREKIDQFIRVCHFSENLSEIKKDHNEKLREMNRFKRSISVFKDNAIEYIEFKIKSLEKLIAEKRQ